MHELSIAGAICRAVKERIGSEPVSLVRIEVGELSGILPDALDFCIREVARAEGLGDPEIIIEETRPLLKCSCGHEYEAQDILEGCPSCGGFDREVVSGMDVTIQEIRTEGRQE